MTVYANVGKRLFIIGNGFDLHHWRGTWPNTSYNAFAAFLQKNRSDIFDLLLQTCFLPHDPADRLWAEFETALADFEPEEVFEKVKDYIDDTNPHEFGAAGWETEKYINLITRNMPEALNEFIRFESGTPLAVQYPHNIDSLKLPLSQESLYLSFNYTDTLERFYQIPASQICYIHGKSGYRANLMIGHGVDPLVHHDEPRQKREPVYDLLLQTSAQDPWEDPSEDHYSMSENLVREEIDLYWSRSFKDAKANLQNNSAFFDRFSNVSTVTIMGHSLSDVDLPYFEEVKRRVSSDALWEVSFYSDSEDREKKSTLMSLGIAEERIHAFRLQDRIVQS